MILSNKKVGSIPRATLRLWPIYQGDRQWWRLWQGCQSGKPSQQCRPPFVGGGPRCAVTHRARKLIEVVLFK